MEKKSLYSIFREEYAELKGEGTVPGMPAYIEWLEHRVKNLESEVMGLQIEVTEQKAHRANNES